MLVVALGESLWPIAVKRPRLSDDISHNARFTLDSYDLPIFGADLVTLPGVHLICIDLQPAHPAQELDAKADEAMHEANK